uniref:Transposase n=1 Tax=Haemonchus placei TaxID=6290 RepID=A0A0N4VXF4_HAEPC
LVEQAHKNETLRKVNEWFSDALYKEVIRIFNKVLAYKNGIYSEFNYKLRSDSFHLLKHC